MQVFFYAFESGKVAKNAFLWPNIIEIGDFIKKI